MYSRTRSRRLLSLLLIVFTAVAGSVSTFAQPTNPTGLSATALTPVRVAERNAGKSQRNGKLVSVIVKLEDAPLASYRGGVAGIPATSPQVTGADRLNPRSNESQRYLQYLDQKQRDFEARARGQIAQARVIHRYRYVLSGVSMLVPSDQVDQLRKLPGVAAVYLDRIEQPDTDNSPQFIGAPVIWGALGGQDKAGENVVVGVLDTGIWPEHPSFADDGSYPAPPAGWAGACEQPTDGSPAIACNNKLIGARLFLDTYIAAQGPLPAGEYNSVRDADGHGTHTASTAAGNPNVPAVVFGVNRGTVSGIAPRARVAAYKVCGPVGCYGSDTSAATDQAVADGVNVINYSISGGVDPYNDPTELAFLDAYEAGVFVAASAGNSGPTAGTVNHAGGWVTTVAASTQDRQFQSTLTLRSGADRLVLEGASITAGVPDFTQVVTSTDTLCVAPFAAGSVAGKIVACERGLIARVEKSYNVLQGGAVGMILYNPTLQDIETDNHWLPTVHLADGTAFVQFLESHANVVAKFTPGTQAPAQGDVMAAFSSRGPSPDRRFIKPDITAPGVQILAGHTPTPQSIVGGPPGELFQAIAGTSMSGPHIAGAGALLKALYPSWTPGMIKSALMTTATRTNLVKEDETTPTDPYDAGSGRVDLTRAGVPGLTFDVRAEQYASSAEQPEQLNYPSIMISSMPGRSGVVRVARSQFNFPTTWNITTSAPPGVTIKTNPERLRIPARGVASFVVIIEAKNVPDGTYFGSVDLSFGSVKVHMPVAFERKQPSVNLTKECDPNTIAVGESTTCTLTVANTNLEPATVNVVDRVPRALDVDSASVTGAQVSGNTVYFNGRLPAAEGTVNVSPGASPFGYFPMANLGVAPLTGVCTACDEAIVTFNVPPFTYGGETHTTLSMVSNGYLIAGDEQTVDFINQRFPDASPPNNVIAPYWTDLDLVGSAPGDAGGGTWYAATVTDGVNNFFVAEWEDAAEWNVAGTAHSFQIWITLGSSDTLHMVYGPNTATAPALTVGAENFNGQVGDNAYVDLTPTGIDGEGVPPAEGDELAVQTSFIPATHVITFNAEGVRAGTYVNTAELTSNQIQGVNLASDEIVVGSPPAE